MAQSSHRGARAVFNRRAALKVSAAAGAAFFTGSIAALSVDGGSGAVPATDHAVRAESRFLKSMNCSQAVLEVYSQELGMPVPLAKRVAAGFAGGMGMGSECGALTGAIMVIGLKYGKTTDTDADADAETFKRIAKFVEGFRARHGDLDCSKLLGIDMSTPEGVKAAEEAGLFTSLCPKFVRSGCEILDEVLA